MHELGIANSVLQEAQQELQRHLHSRLRKIKLRVGEMSGVNPEALRFCFEAMARESQVGQVELEIEICARRQRCPACNQTFTVVDYSLTCPTCGSSKTEFAGGDELELCSLEMEDYEPGVA